MGHGSAVDIDFKKCPKMIFFKSRGLFLGPGGSEGYFLTGSIKFGNILIFLIFGGRTRPRQHRKKWPPT